MSPADALPAHREQGSGKTTPPRSAVRGAAGIRWTHQQSSNFVLKLDWVAHREQKLIARHCGQ